MQCDAVTRRALDAAHHLHATTPPWREVLEGLCHLAGGSSASFTMFDGAGGLVEFQLVHGDPQAGREYMAHFYPHDIMNPVARRASAGQWLDSAQSYTPAQLGRNMFYADFMCRYRARQFLAFMVEASPLARTAVCVQRSEPHAQVPQWLAAPPMQALTQAISAALQQRRASAALAMDTVAAALHSFGEAALLVTADGALVHPPGPAALDWLEQPGALRLRDGRLHHPDLHWQARWCAALQQAVRAGRAQLALPVQSRRVHRLELAPASARMVPGRHAAVLVRVTAARQPAALEPELLRATLGLTVAEAQVLAALVEGLCATAIAERQGVRISTVRTQIAALMTKMDCSRQTDLVRKAVALA